MNKVYLAVVLACWGSAAMAAEQVEVNQVSDLTGAVSGAARIGALATGDGEFRQVRVVKLPNGQQRVRYEQTWQGIPVWGQVLVADQAVLITGGRNVGDSYFRPTPAAQSFTDLDVIAAGGPAVQAARFFEQYWHGPDSYPVRDVFRPDGRDEAEALQQLARSPRLPESKRFLEALQKTPLVQDLLDGRLQWIWAPAEFMSDLPDKLYRNIRPEDTIPGMIAAELRTPSRQLDLVSAYFIPTEAQVQQLVQMARRGVRIRVLTNSLASTDVPLVHAFYLKKRRTLLQAGIRIIEFFGISLASFQVGGGMLLLISSLQMLNAQPAEGRKEDVNDGDTKVDAGDSIAIVRFRAMKLAGPTFAAMANCDTSRCSRWIADCRAAAKSRAVAKRSSRFFASARATTASMAGGRRGLIELGGVGLCPMIWWMIEKSLSPSNGRLSVSNW